MNCDVPLLWEEYKNQLRAFILKRVKDRNATEEILQDVLVKFYEFCVAKSGINNLRSWLFQIAQNTITDYYRNHSKIISAEEFPETDDTEENIAFLEAQKYIEPIINFLPEKYAVPLKLFELEGRKQQAIADELGISLAAVKSRILRGRDLLKAEFITCCHLQTNDLGNIISFEIKDSCKPLKK